jgi:hypothetical protein
MAPECDWAPSILSGTEVRVDRCGEPDQGSDDDVVAEAIRGGGPKGPSHRWTPEASDPLGPDRDQAMRE